MALKNMLAAGSRLVIDAMVLSEYLNTYCRIEWKALHNAAQPNFKKFRKSPAFLTVGQGAATFARGMLKLCARHDHPFAAADVTRLLTDFEAGTNDFNDGLLAATCRHHGWKLVTNDSDFTTGGIEVLTSHPVLLKACP
jgi:predicted nucleic acid-binding protein